jgi:hypothetical protein
MPFEYAVRPFQTPGAQGRIRIPSAPQGFDQRATLTWGNKTSLDSMGKKGISVSTHWPDFSEGCCTEESAQKSNEMETVTVANEGANGGSVTFQRAKWLKLDKEHRDACGDMAVWYNVQMNASDASIMKNYATLAAQMGVRTPEPEKCKVQATFNNV